MTSASWRLARPGDAPVAIELPFALAKRAFDVVVGEAYRAAAPERRRLREPGELAALAELSRLIGSALNVPENEIFHFQERFYFAVFAPAIGDYRRWLRGSYAFLRPEVRARECAGGEPAFVGRPEDALGRRFVGFRALAGAERRSDFAALVAAVRANLVDERDERSEEDVIS